MNYFPPTHPPTFFLSPKKCFPMCLEEARLQLNCLTHSTLKSCRWILRKGQWRDSIHPFLEIGNRDWKQRPAPKTSPKDNLEISQKAWGFPKQMLPGHTRKRSLKPGGDMGKIVGFVMYKGSRNRDDKFPGNRKRRASFLGPQEEKTSGHWPTSWQPSLTMWSSIRYGTSVEKKMPNF